MAGLKKLEVYNDKSKKLRNVIRDLQTVLKTNLTDDYRKKISKELERLTSLQIEYEVDFKYKLRRFPCNTIHYFTGCKKFS